MATNWEYRHFRTKNRAEIDLIFVGAGKIIPIEIKYGMRIEMRKLQTLKDFITAHHLP